MRKITFYPNAYADYLKWLETDKKVFLKINQLIKESAKTPLQGSGKPEILKHEFSGFCSRRINHEHRLVYSFDESSIEIISCKYHYQ